MQKEYRYFASLIETRVLLEIESAKLAAERRTHEDIEDIRKALIAYEAKVELNELAVEEDLMFHLKIAEASKNAVLKSLLLVITPDLIQIFLQLEVYKNRPPATVLHEHEAILEHIIAQETEKAAAAMRKHLQDVFEYIQRLKKRQENGSNGMH